MGIIENSKLWLSDIEFLNDSTELGYAADLLHTSIRGLVNDTCDPIRPDPGEHRVHHLLCAALDALESRFQIGECRESGHGRSESFAMWEGLPFVASFCENGDLLSMWRGYADTGGFSIEFDTKGLLEACNPISTTESTLSEEIPPSSYFFTTRLTPVIYGEEELRKQFQDIIQSLTEASGNHPGVSASYSIQRLIPLFSTIKHPTFSEEKEIRLIAQPTGDMTPRPSLRTGPRHLVPYQELDLPLTVIRSITVGPSPYQDRNVKALERRFNYLPNGVRIKIRQSEIPLA